MKLRAKSPQAAPFPGVMRRLASDRSGNTLALIAAGLLPLLAMAGSGVDMSRAYLAESRLQQACDSGVLAARKALGTEIATLTDIPTDAGTRGQEFFNSNFQDGNYGTQNRTFNMVLENDYSVSGTATVDVPTSVMTVFGFTKIPVKVECQARISFSDVDVMMVLDVTGSMKHTNSGDTLSKIDSLKATVRNFYDQMEGAKSAGTRIRYGFVPYASNVNVGHLLKDEWVVNSWAYQSRAISGTTTVEAGTKTRENWAYKSGSRSAWIEESTYAATMNPGSGDTNPFSCDQSLPKSTYKWHSEKNGIPSTSVTMDPPGVRTTQPMQSTENGVSYRVRLQGSNCIVERREYNDYVQTFDEVTVVPTLANLYNYLPVAMDVSNWRAEALGCMEERKSTVLTDFSSVDLSANLDLDINTVPVASDQDTQWRPRYPDMIYVRSKEADDKGSFSPAPVYDTKKEFIQTGNWWFSGCPAPAQKLKAMTSGELDSYLDSLTPHGATYHDGGMIWGGRLLSQYGLFAAENSSKPGRTTSRHLIFLTDGQTEPYDLAYGSYGIDPIDERRWTQTSSLTLAQTVEERFLFACNEVKKLGATVWVVAFGTAANDKMKTCAGSGRYFEAANASQLNDAFSTIAKSTGDLRIAR
ncbi:TadE/TadG family type IV pilus assembly protein [Erythrobacter litoralis]|nr:TadE/TadG family type IV pilus assembly protein [Erythrobacter litoralis]